MIFCFRIIEVEINTAIDRNDVMIQEACSSIPSEINDNTQKGTMAVAV